MTLVRYTQLTRPARRPNLAITTPPIQFPEFPTVARLGELSGENADCLKSYALHQYELNFCVLHIPDWGKFHSENILDLADAVFITIVSKLVSCFQHSKSRSKLDKNLVYGLNTELRNSFEYFENIRNKHLIHDQNNMFQCQAVALLDDEGVVLDVKTLIGHMFLRPATHSAQLRSLTRTALVHVDNKVTELCKCLMNDVSVMSPEERAKLPRPSMYEPVRDDSSKNRRK